MRKLAAVTTRSFSSSPLLTSTSPSPRRPSVTSRGSKRPSPLSSRTSARLPVSITALSGAVDDRVLLAAENLRLDIHVRPQDQIGVGQLDAHARRARLAIDLRIDDRHMAGEGAIGKAARSDLDRLADAQPRIIMLGDIDQRPDDRKIGDAEQHLAGLGLHSVDGVALENDAVARRGPGDARRHAPAPWRSRR